MYIGIVKFKSDIPYEEIEGFKVNTNESNIEKAREFMYGLCSNLSKANNVQVRWNFEGLSQGHYCDDWYFKEDD